MKCATILALLLHAAAAMAQENLVLNGDFESPSAGDMYLTFQRGEVIDGWLVEKGSVEVVGLWWDAASGQQSLDLNGDERGAVFQSLQTQPGQKYVLRFALAANADGERGRYAIEIVWDDKVVAAFDFEKTHQSHRDMGWQYKEVTVEATGQKTSLGFISLDEEGKGPVIDDVSVVAVRAEAEDDQPAPPATRPSHRSAQAGQ